jgi:hypothetical protein
MQRCPNDELPLARVLKLRTFSPRNPSAPVLHATEIARIDEGVRVLWRQGRVSSAVQSTEWDVAFVRRQALAFAVVSAQWKR